MSKKYYYSPGTGEHVVTASPADWLLWTELEPPPHTENQSAIFADGAWSIIDPPPAPILPVTDLQIRLALNELGLRQSVDAAVAAGDQDLKDLWDRALTLRRDHPKVIELGETLGQTPDQMDDLWRLAATK